MAADPPAQFPGFYLIVSISLDMLILQCPKGISQMPVTPQNASSLSSVAATCPGPQMISDCFGWWWGP